MRTTTALVNDAKKRAKLKGFEFNLDVKYIDKLIKKNECCCALTGIVFSNWNPSTSNKRPLIPSIDRIKSNRGYVKGNVRVVLSAVNMALHTWGDEVFDEVCRKRVEKMKGSYTKGLNDVLKAYDEMYESFHAEVMSLKHIARHKQNYIKSLEERLSKYNEELFG